MNAASHRDAGALTERCAAGCHRHAVPYEVVPDAAGTVVARYACRCGALWTSSWSTALLPAGSPLRGPS